MAGCSVVVECCVEGFVLGYSNGRGLSGMRVAYVWLVFGVCLCEVEHATTSHSPRSCYRLR